jgi:hypothetical protein
MAKVQDHGSGPPTGLTTYRITACGKAVAAWEQLDTRTRHVIDLLELLQTASQGVAEAHLRQFMPHEPLKRAIESLTALGLIEPHESRGQAMQAQAARTPRAAPGANRMLIHGVRRG